MISLNRRKLNIYYFLNIKKYKLNVNVNKINFSSNYISEKNTSMKLDTRQKPSLHRYIIEIRPDFLQKIRIRFIRIYPINSCRY